MKITNGVIFQICRTVSRGVKVVFSRFDLAIYHPRRPAKRLGARRSHHRRRNCRRGHAASRHGKTSPACRPSGTQTTAWQGQFQSVALGWKAKSALAEMTQENVSGCLTLDERSIGMAACLRINTMMKEFGFKSKFCALAGPGSIPFRTTSSGTGDVRAGKTGTAFEAWHMGSSPL